MVIPGEFLAAQASNSEQLRTEEKVIAIVNYVKKILHELKVRTVSSFVLHVGL